MYIKVIWISCLLFVMSMTAWSQADMTIQVQLTHNADICVGQSVLLTCPDDIADKDVLTYEWVQMKGSDSVVISNDRSVIVRPSGNTTYHLNILYMDQTRNLVKQGDFEGIDDSRCEGDGKGPFPTIADLPFYTDYKWYNHKCGDMALWDEGAFKIAKNPRDFHKNFDYIFDHTSGDGTGQMLLVNGHQGKDVIVWQQKITGVSVGTEYAFSAWGRKVADGATPRFQFSISDKKDDFDVIGGFYTTYPVNRTWTLLFKVWEAKFNTAYITLINQERGASGNDFVVDDIVFAPVRKMHGDITLKVKPYFRPEDMKDRKVCEGVDVEVKPVFYGEANKFEWYKNGVLLPGQTSKDLILNDVLSSDAGRYKCVMSGGACGSGEAQFALTVYDSTRLKPLDDQIVNIGSPANFRLTVLSGESQIGYYYWSGPPAASGWRNDWLTPEVYSKYSVEKTDIGVYTCKVVATCGDVSVSARLDTMPKVKAEVPGPMAYCPGDPELKLIGKRTPSNTSEGYWVRVTPPDPAGTVYFGDTLVLKPVVGEVAGIYEYIVRMKDSGFEFSGGLVPVDLRDTLQSLEFKGGGEYCVGERNVVVTATPKMGGGTDYYFNKARHFTYVWKFPSSDDITFLDNNSFVIGTITPAKEGYYSVSVSETCNLLKDSVKISIKGDFGTPVISGDVQVCVGESAQLEVLGGAPGLTYKWTTPSGREVLSSAITLNRILPQDTGWYNCRLTSVCGETRDLRAHVSLYPSIAVNEPATPFIVCEGERVEFTVVVRPNEHYIWKRNGVQGGNPDQPYVIDPAHATDAGVYECVVTSPCGDTKVLKYVLQVHEQTKVVGKSPDFYVTPGTSVTMFVNAIGSDLVYRWTKTGSGNIGVGNSNTLVVDAAGEYVCTVTGKCGTDKATINVYVGDYNEVVKDQSVNVCIGSTYSYTAAARPDGCTEGAVLLYSWKGPDGREVSNTKALVLNNVTAATAGVYTCTISGTCGTTTLHLTVTVFEVPVLALSVNKDTVCEGESVKMTTSVNNVGGHTFEWRHEGVILGTTIGQHTIADVATGDAGKYTCKVASFCGSDTKELNLAVRRGLKIQQRPNDLFLCKGTPTELKVVATGDNVIYSWAGPAAGEWQGNHDASYRNPAISHDAEGKYRCVVGSNCGVDTVYANIEVEKDLELVSRTPNLAACIGEKVKLWARVNLDRSRLTWTFPNGTTSNLEEITINSITTADRGRYAFYIESPAGCSSLRDSIGIGVYDAPGPLVASPADTAVCLGGQGYFTASMGGVDVSYSWMGPSRFTSDSNVIDVKNVTEAKTGTYQVIARDICKNERVAEVRLSLKDDFKHIKISADTAVCLHSDVRLRVEGGVPGMTYRWIYNGAEIAQGAVLSVTNVDYADAGEYVCRITGVCETVEKSVKLSVLQPLEFEAITDLDAFVCAGETVVFGVKTSGVGVTYSWKKGGVDVGTMDSLLTLTNVERWEAGHYECHISSVCGDEQLGFDLRVKPQTKITGRSPDKYVSIGDSVQLFIITQGMSNQFEWKQNNLVAGTDSLLKIPDVGLDIREVTYQAKVTGDCGADSVDIILRIGEYINVPIVGGSADTICEGSNYTYVANLVPYGCYGGEPVQYEWVKKEIAGDVIVLVDSNSLFKIQDAVVADTGLYKCTITYKGCPIDGFDKNITRDTSFNLQLDMIRVPAIVSITPVDTAVIEGFNHKIEVVAEGDALEYSWKKNEVALNDRMGGQLIFNPALVEDAGIYRVTVSNKCSHVSAVSRLRVDQKTVILSPFEQTVGVCRYSDTTLMVEAIGTNLIYRWYRDNRLVASSRNNKYTLSNVQADVDFRCVVEGNGGYDTCYFYVRVVELPELTLSGRDAVCMSPEVYLQQYSAESPEVANLTWNWSCTGGTIRSLSAKRQIEVMWNGVGNASVSVVATSLITKCSNRVTKNVRYVPLPEVWLDLPEKVGYCIDSLVLNHVWPLGGKFVSEGDTVTSVKFYAKTKDYEVTYYYTDPLTQCEAKESQGIGIDIEPAIRLAKRNDTTGVCRPLTLVVQRHTPGRITWGGSGLHLDTTDILRPVFSPVVADVENVYYEATLTDVYDCKASDYERIRVVYPPKVIAMKDTVVGNCTDEQVDLSLSAQYVTAYFDRIDWLPASQVDVLADYTAKVLTLKPGLNEFVADVVDVFGCSDRDSVIVTLAAGPDVTDREVCFGDTLYVDNSGYPDFRWSDGYVRPIRTITLVGTDTLWVKDNNGCEAKAAYTIRPLPQTNLTDTSLMRGQRLELPLALNPDYAPYDIIWQDGSAVSVYLVEREGEYWVKVVDNMGCTALDTAMITLIEGIHAPNAFLPESSGENSRFYLKEVNFVDNFEMYIYNRWGELIYKTKQIGFNGGWDGTFKGRKCDVGTYVWVAFNNGKRLARGTVTLIK